MPLTNRPKTHFALAAGVLFIVVACSGGDRPPPETPVTELPPYTVDEQLVFDDSIAPEVFGLDVDGSSVDDPSFVQRAMRADLITRAKLLTITSDELAGQTSYHVTLKPLGAPLFGFPSKGNIEITVGRASPSLTLLRSMAVKGVGQKLIVLLRNYRLDDGRVVHFRGEPDTEEIANALQSLRGAKKNQEN